MFLLLVLFSGLAGAAGAEPRIALVIGNGAYQSVRGLPNPPNDARLMAATLEQLGFQVTLVAEGTLDEMSAAVARFGGALREAGPETTGLFYYAGHGVQSFGVNYLLPVDAKLSNAADLGLVAVDAQSVLRQMFSARNRTNIVILDACRNNPFVNVRDLTDNGLAEMAAPTGTFLAYATAPGGVALDGLGDNSPFTRALAEEMVAPGLAIEQMFKQVRVAVLEATGGRQTPWDTSSLTAAFSFAAAAGTEDEAALWASVMVSRDPVQVMLFLRAYPGSPHEAEARALLSEVMAKEVKPKQEAKPAADPAEVAAFEAAQAAGTAEALQSFVDAYPNSGFALAVTAEIAALGDAPRVTVPDAVDAGLAAEVEASQVSFAKPLAAGTPDIAGRSIEELIGSSPLYAPIEGLPKEAWEGQPCAACHQWTEAALCDQGKFYVKEAAPAVSESQHPLGGAFKITLRTWASQGCR